MVRRSRFLGFIAAVLGAAMLVPAVASAQVPEVPPGTIPPEVQDAIDEALAEALTQLPNPLVPAIDGVGQASVSPGHAQASVVEIPDVVTVGKSESSKDGSKVTVLNVGGTDVLVRDGDGSGGTWGGEAAAAGQGIDELNNALCPGGPPAANGEPKACVLLLYSTAQEGPPSTTGTTIQTTNNTNSASFRALSIYSPAGPESLTVGSTSASTIETTARFGTTVLAHGCTDVATSFLISGTGQLAALFLVNPGGPLNGVKFSIFQPC